MSFKAVQSKIEKQGGYSKKAAGAILANATRHASASAKKANPKLKKVKGGDKTLDRSSMKGAALIENRPFVLKDKAAYKSGSNRPDGK